MRQRRERRLVEAFVTQPAVEGFHKGVLRRLARRDVVPFDALFRLLTARLLLISAKSKLADAITPPRAGSDCRCFSKTAASRWTATPSSEPSGPLLSIVRTLCSPARTTAATTGPSSPVS